MLTNHVTNATTNPLSLSYPNLPQRVGECIFGSARREALKALRAATVDQWSYTNAPVPSVTVRDGRGDEVIFQYDAYNNLDSVHLTSERGTLHITGECELAQRLSRFATRALSSLLQRATVECKEHLTLFVDGSRPARSHYDQQQSHRHIARDGFESTKNKTAIVEFPTGSTVEIISNEYTYRLPADERWKREQERLAWCAHIIDSPRLVREGAMHLESPHPSTPFGGAMLTTNGYDASPAKVFFSPPPAPDRGTETSLKATVRNQKLDDLASTFGVEPLATRFSRMCRVDKEDTNTLLTQALSRAERSMVTSSEGGSK